MLRKTLAFAAVVGLLTAGVALAAGDAKHPHKQAWSFAGPLGKFDQAELQRGFKVYKEVCAACHSLSMMSFRNLGEKHGPFYDPEFPNPNDNPYVKAIAADWVLQVNDIDGETGDPIKRPATTADRFPNPYPNSVAAAAGNGGAVPPDLSVIIKARHDGANYVYSLLTGYSAAPAGVQKTPAQHYNEYFPGHLIAMPPPLTVNKVTFDDNTVASVKNQAKAVTAFLAWASEPKQTERKQTGLAVMIYLILLSLLVYASYRRVWRNESH